MNPTQEKTYSATDEKIHFVFVKGKEQKTLSQPSVPNLFDQVVQRYREELEKLKDDPEFRPLYIGIKDMGEEIHVWAVLSNPSENKTRNTLSALRRIIASDLPIHMEIFTWFRYESEDQCHRPCNYITLLGT